MVFIAKARIYVNKAGQVVPEDDAGLHFLLFGVGATVSDAAAARYNLDEATYALRDRTPRPVDLTVTRVPLGDSDDPGGILAWANPEGSAVLVTGVYLLLTSGGADMTDFGDLAVAGPAPDATTRVATLGSLLLDQDAYPTIMRPIADTGTLVPAGQYLTISTDSGSAAGLAGYAYIHYHRA